jgi:hypothetical protein
MSFALQLRDVLGPLISVGAAGLSWFFFWKTAIRATYFEGQWFLIEICKQLVADPDLWCLFDDHPLVAWRADRLKEPLLQAKIEAFAHLHLNMFEIILKEAPNPGRPGKENLSNVWVNYFEDTLARSRRVREILDAPESGRIWSEALREKYDDWKRRSGAVA